MPFEVARNRDGRNLGSNLFAWFSIVDVTECTVTLESLFEVRGGQPLLYLQVINVVLMLVHPCRGTSVEWILVLCW